MRMPIRRIRSRCCARAASGHAATAPPSAASNSRRPMVTIMRPSRARCVEGRIPRHARVVFTFKEAGGWLLPPLSRWWLRQVHRPAVTHKSHLDGRASRSHHIALHQRRRNGGRAMNNDAASFIGNIPEHYDSGLGPMVFVDYAADIARRAAACSPARVLETAAGTGIVTRQLRNFLPPGVHLTATDLNAPMLEVARTKFRPGEEVAFQPADAAALPFSDGTFDAVVCQFGVMFFPQKDTSYREVHRVLAPGGRYLFSVWDSHRHNPFGRIAHETAASFFPADPPQFYMVPFSYYQIDPIKESLIDARFTDLSVAVIRLEKEIPDAARFARGLVYGNPLIDQIKARGGVDPDRIVNALAQALRQEFGSDPGQMPLQAIVFSANRR